MADNINMAANKPNFNLYSHTLPERSEKLGAESGTEPETRYGSELYQPNSVYESQPYIKKPSPNVKMIIAKCISIAFATTLLYYMIMFKRIDKHKLENLVPNIPYIFSYNTSRYEMYPLFYGYDVYECDDVVHIEDDVIYEETSVYFTPQYRSFRFRVMGYTTFSIDITDDKGEKITNEIILFEDDQRETVRYFSCTNVICQFEIQARIPELKIIIVLSTTNIDKSQCTKLERKVQKDAFETIENNYWYYECESNRLTVLIPQEQEIENCTEVLIEDYKGKDSIAIFQEDDPSLLLDIASENSDIMSGIHDKTLYQWGEEHNNEIQIYRYYKIDTKFESILCFIIFVTAFNIILMIEVNR